MSQISLFTACALKCGAVLLNLHPQHLFFARLSSRCKARPLTLPEDFSSTVNQKRSKQSHTCILPSLAAAVPELRVVSTMCRVSWLLMLSASICDLFVACVVNLCENSETFRLACTSALICWRFGLLAKPPHRSTLVMTEIRGYHARSSRILRVRGWSPRSCICGSLKDTSRQQL